MRRRVRTVERGVEFHLFFEKGSDHELHITAAHGATPDDAIAAYFDGVTEFDVSHQRFVSSNATHTLLWNWIEEGESVYVITCVKAGE